MMKVALLCGMLLALAASVVSAAPGTNLRWNTCFGDGGAPNRAFACDTNVGLNSLAGSFEIGADILQANGLEIVIDLASASPTLPAWWSFKNVGTCRQTALFMSVSGALTAVICYDWAAGQGQATGGIGTYTVGGLGPNSARLRLATAVPATALADLFAATEYYGFNLIIRNVKTLGTVAIPACPGCQTAVSLVFNSVKVTTQDAANDRTFSGPTNGTDSNYATWQGGAATPTHNATWGAVKSLYR